MLAFVGIPLPKPHSKSLIEIKRKHQPKGSKLEPHLTLLPPGELTVSIEAAAERLKQSKFDSATIKTQGIDGVRRRGGAVIFLKVEPTDQLLDLQRQIANQFNELIVYGEKPNKPFRPHITILRTRTAAYTNKMFRILESMNLDFEFAVDSVRLYTKEKPGDDWSLQH